MIAISSACTHGAFSLTVDFQFDNGIIGLFGASGAGKSTLLRSIAGLTPTPARLTIDGAVLDAVPAHDRRVGLVFQDDLLFPHLSVADNLRYGIGTRPLAFDDVIAGLGLKHLLHRRPATLSGGERQRVALGRSLLPRPRLLLGDEPLSSLDHESKRIILPFLRNLCTSLPLPMIYVSHDLGELLTLTDRLIVLDHGKIVGQGSFDELKADLRIRPLLYDEALLRRCIDD